LRGASYPLLNQQKQPGIEEVMLRVEWSVVDLNMVV
jgi:hypothetical protein